MANAPLQQPVSSLSTGMAAHIQNNINSILGNPHDPNPGQTLQKYVSQFQDDPSHYTPVLAMATATQSHLATQKQLSSAPQQPPVAQQAFAKLGQPAQPPQQPQQRPAAGVNNGPESSGIGQLPSGNIEGMAGGGITGMPSFSGNSGSYVSPAQESMASNITPDQALAAGYTNPLYSYGANEAGGSIQGLPMKAGGVVQHFDDGGQVNSYGIQQPMGYADPLRIAMQNSGFASGYMPTAKGTQGIPMNQYPLNPAEEARQAMGGGPVPQQNVAPQTPQKPAPSYAPNVSLNSVMAQGPITAQSLTGAPQPAAQPGQTAQPPAQQSVDISQISPNFTPGSVAQGGVVSLAKSLGFDPNMTMASAQAQWEKGHINPINAQQLDLGYQTQQIKAAMLANGVDPDQNKQFKALEARQEASDAMLDKKQNLSIMAAGLGMIKAGNPWEAIAGGAQQGVNSYREALDAYQQQQQHMADTRMALDQSKQLLNAGMVDKAMGQVDQATKYQFDYNKNSADNVRSIFEANRSGLAGLAEHQMATNNQIAVAQIQAGAQKYSADQMFGARTQVAQTNMAGRGSNAAIAQQTQQAKMMMANPDRSIQNQGIMLLHRLNTPYMTQTPPTNAQVVPGMMPTQ